MSTIIILKKSPNIFNFYKKIHTKQQYQLQAFKVETTFNSIVVLYYNII